MIPACSAGEGPLAHAWLSPVSALRHTVGGMLTTVAVSGYRSLRDVVVPLHGLDVVTGANGSGKSSLYRALRLLAGCGRGDVIGTLAREGGLQSALWAGPATLGGARREGYAVQGTSPQGADQPAARFRLRRLRLPRRPRPAAAVVRQRRQGAAVGVPARPRDQARGRLGRAGHAARLGARAPPVGRVETRATGRRATTGGTTPGAATTSGSPTPSSPAREAPAAEAQGRAPHRRRAGWVELTRSLRPWESMLTELADPERAPELLRVRRMIRGWRFYDCFRADAAAPARQAHVGTRTPVLADDGHDLAAALQTIRENGRSVLDRAVADAFDGAILDVTVEGGRFDVPCTSPACCARSPSAELSDGTLRYLLLVAALLTVDPPPLLVLNEPETSLHPDLLPPLARLIRAAAERSQVMVVSHSDARGRAGSAPPTTTTRTTTTGAGRSGSPARSHHARQGPRRDLRPGPGPAHHPGLDLGHPPLTGRRPRPTSATASGRGGGATGIRAGQAVPRASRIVRFSGGSGKFRAEDPACVSRHLGRPV